MEVTVEGNPDLEARLAALERPRADDFLIAGHSVVARLYATEALHKLVPDRLALRIAWGIGWLRWYWPSARRKAIARVSLTVAGTEREGEERKLARRELCVEALRVELPWRRRLLSRAPADGLERLEAVRDSGRPAILTGAHIGAVGLAVVRERGFSSYTATGAWLDPDAPIERRGYQAYKARARRRQGEQGGNRYVIMGGSFELLRALLERGETCTIFCDTPGRMRTRMAGKAAHLASGPAVLSHLTGAVVVPTVCLIDTAGPHLRILEPIDPRGASGPQEIVDRLAAIYGELMVRHPEQVAPLGYTRDVFKEEGAAYPRDLWWPPAMRTRAKNKTRNAVLRLRAKLDGAD